MLKCDFKATLLKSHFGMGCSPINLLHIFGIPFPKNITGQLPLILYIFNRGEYYFALLMASVLQITAINLIQIW